MSIKNNTRTKNIHTAPKYNWQQKYQITKGAEDGLTQEEIGIYANPKYHWRQMQEIRSGFTDGLSMEQVKTYTNPKYHWKRMQEIRMEIEQGYRFAEPECVVYGREDCMSCKMLTRYLERNNIKFDYKDIDQHPELIKNLKQQGIYSLPVVTYDDKVKFCGYNPTELKKLSEEINKNKATETVVDQLENVHITSHFSCLDDFVKFISVLFPYNNKTNIHWCPSYFKHTSAVIWLRTLWYSYEQMYLEEDMESYSNWLIHVATPIMNHITGVASPFINCSNQHQDNKVFKVSTPDTPIIGVHVEE